MGWLPTYRMLEEYPTSVKACIESWHVFLIEGLSMTQVGRLTVPV